jgi:HEAT repeat protein
VNPLIEALNDENVLVQKQAVEELEKIGTSVALEAVRRYREKHPNDEPEG